MSSDERLVGDILRQHSLPNPVWTDKDDIRRLANKIECQDGFERSTIASCRPTPIELVERLESAEACAFHPAFKTSANMFIFFPLQERRKPRCIRDFRPVCEQAVKTKRLCALA
jgi:hypothetical protein